MEPLIIADSCCDVNPELQKRLKIQLLPYTIETDQQVWLDDGGIDLDQMRDEMDAMEGIPKTAAVTPQRFYEAAKDAKEAFIVTISKKLSSTYNNAMIAAKQLIDEGKKVHVFDSKGACSGETVVAQKIRELIDQKFSFEDIVEKVEEFLKDSRLWFVLEDLGVLVKAGRIPKLSGKVLSKLSIKPICYSDNGSVGLGEVRRGMKSAISHLCKAIEEYEIDHKERTLFISHNRCDKEARAIVERMKKLPWKGVELVEARGLTAVYAHPGGVIVAF